VKSTHTQGPWVAGQVSQDSFFVHPEHHAVWVVAKTYTQTDANLIAAAPDLLEACIEALSLFDNYPQCYEAIGTYQVLNNAIKKATQ